MTRPHRRRAQLVALLALTLVACAKADKPADSSGGLADSTPRPLAAGTAAAPLPGALTKPIDDYSGDELYALVQTLKFEGGHERDRKCKDAPGCGGTKPTAKTRVRVDAVAGQDSLWAGDVPQYGVIDVRALNKGSAEEARYDLRVGAKYEYYLIVMRGTGDSLRWRLEELDTTPKSRAHSERAAGAFTGCGHTWWAGAKADFKTCKSAASGDSTMKMGLLFQAIDSDPIWVGCGMGCCVADS